MIVLTDVRGGVGYGYVHVRQITFSYDSRSPRLLASPVSPTSACPPASLPVPSSTYLQQVLLQRHKTAGQITTAASAAAASGSPLAPAKRHPSTPLPLVSTRPPPPPPPPPPPTDPRLLCNAAGHMPLHYATIRRDLALMLHPAFRCGRMCEYPHHTGHTMTCCSGWPCCAPSGMLSTLVKVCRPH